MVNRQISIVFGVFKGMGDVLSAAPVILQELREGQSVHLLLFSNASLLEFCQLVDFSPHQGNLHLHAIPSASHVTAWIRFFAAMRRIDPKMVWISPHAPMADSSWKVPLILRFIQILFWKNARLTGADTERLSQLFHQRLPVNRGLPLQKREWSAYRLLRGHAVAEDAPEIGFLPEIARLRNAPPAYDLVIHPGATAKNRIWPHNKYAPLLASLPSHWRIAILGLPTDIASIKATLPSESQVHLISGTIRKSLETLASARMLFVMDSGNMHFAQVLKVPALALFAYHDPSTVIDACGFIEALYEPRFPCQPCDRAICTQPEIYCLNSIEPEFVAAKIKTKWQQIDKTLAVQKKSDLNVISNSQ